MPFDAETGRVYAPVGVASVAQALGETSLDAGTLCCSEKINEASLIRPQYFRDDDGVSPFRGIEVAVNTQGGLPLVVPAAKMEEVYKDSAGFDCTSDEYDFPQGLHYAYQRMKWGYCVPYVGSLGAIFILRDLYWRRYGPKDGVWTTNADGSKTLHDTWCALHHFDGYLAGAKAPDFMQNVVLAYGQKPQFTPVMVSGKWKDDEVLNAKNEYINNNGGVVSVPAVFGTEMYYGASLFRKKADGKYELMGHVFGGDSTNPPTSDLGGGGPSLPMLKPVVMNDITLGSGNNDAPHGCVLIPWVSSKQVTEDSTGKITVPAGTRFYGLNWFQTAKNYAEADSIAARRFAVTWINRTLVNGKWHISFTLVNPGYELKAYIFDVQYRYGGQWIKATTNLTANENNLMIGRPPQSGAYEISHAYNITLTNAPEGADAIRVYINCIDNQYTTQITAKQVIDTTVDGGIQKPSDSDITIGQL